jgi:HEAT repeat protein
MTESLQTLIEELHNPDSNIRSRAALSIGERADTDALPALIGRVGTEADLNVREDITWSLVRIGDAALLPLIDLLRDASAAVRHHAAHTLGKIGDARAVDALIGVLQDNDEAVVLKTIFVLGQIGDARAIPALVQLLESEQQDVQATLVSALEGFGAVAIPALAGALIHERWQVREQAASILGLIGGGEAVPALLPALQDEEWQVRFAAVMALSAVGGSVARTAVQPLENDAHERVRQLVTKLLPRMRR